jgi:AcrR family transcriptional regulator
LLRSYARWQRPQSGTTAIGPVAAAERGGTRWAAPTAFSTRDRERYWITNAILRLVAHPERVRRRPRAETRRELLDAAARVFARRGFHGASVEEVSEEAGFSTGALYSNFAGKEDLFLALWEERIERRRRELREVIARSGGPSAGLAPAAADVVEHMGRERDWFLLYLEFLLHAARDKAFARRFATVREEGMAQLADGVAEGLKAAGIESSLEPLEIATAIRALSYGLALDRLVDEQSVPDELLGEMLRLIFGALRAQ